MGYAAATTIQSCPNVEYLALTVPSVKASQKNNNNRCTTVTITLPLLFMSVIEIDDKWHSGLDRHGDSTKAALWIKSV
jgi:hypothetical protein